MPEDGIFVREDWIQDPKNKDIAARFLRASFKGWEYCRDNADACVAIMVKNDAPGGAEAQTGAGRQRPGVSVTSEPRTSAMIISLLSADLRSWTTTKSPSRICSSIIESPDTRKA